MTATTATACIETTGESVVEYVRRSTAAAM